MENDMTYAMEMVMRAAHGLPYSDRRRLRLTDLEQVAERLTVSPDRRDRIAEDLITIAIRRGSRE